MLRIIWYILNPKQLKEVLLDTETQEEKDEIDIYLGLKQFAIMKSDQIDEVTVFTEEVKEQAFTMINSLLERTDEEGILYSEEKSANLDKALKKEVRKTSLKLDEKVAEFTNLCLVPYKGNVNDLKHS